MSTRLEMRAARKQVQQAIQLSLVAFALCGSGWVRMMRNDARERFAAALAAYRLSKTHDLEYCLRLTKAGIDVRALGGAK